MDTFCWLQKGSRPERGELLSTGIDTKFLWGNLDYLVVEDGLICKKIGPLVDSSTKVTVHVPQVLRKKVICQCHNTKTAGHFFF